MLLIKRLTVIILGLLIGHCLLAQELLSTESAELKLPKSSRRINKQEMLDRVRKLSDHSAFEYMTRIDNIYAIGNMTMVICEYAGSPNDKRTLEDILESKVSLYRGMETITVENASIKIINKQRFIVFKYRQENVYGISIQSERKNAKTLNGLLEYTAADKEQAEASIQEILSSLKRK